jgi:2-oxoisovalerate dehydrogenase E2 component (dihydrolipoyl transacylase)
MPYTLTLPEVGETVTEGTVERWLKQPGDKVQKYEPLVEINTDKVNVELPSPVSGTILELLVPEGETVPIGASLCTIEAVAGEEPAVIAPPGTESSAELPAAPSSSAQPAARAEGGKNRATPRVRKLAADLGVDLEGITGSGPGGRIVEDDVRAAADGAKPSVGGGPRAPVAAGAGDEKVPLTAIRKTIAQRMSESARETPVAWLVIEADATDLVILRNDLKEQFRQEHGADLTYLAFAAHAVCGALGEHPYLNASWAGDSIVLKQRINLGIAAATERGLLVPVIPDAAGLSVSELALAIADLGQRARDNKLKLEDVQGGTFTLDNTGAFGSLISQPIINLGQSAIMSLEAITKRPVVTKDDAIAIRSVVNLCLSFDHRVLDGHQAGAFLQDVRGRLESFSRESSIT